MKFRILIAFSLLIAFASCESNKQKLQNNISANEKKLFADSMVTPNEDSVVKILVQDYQNFAKENPTDSLASEYIFKAADLCKNIRKYKQALDLWSLEQEKYPTSKRAPYSLFLQAFTYETDMNDTARARKLYQDFINKYPQHPLTASAKSSMDNLGISPEELIKKFEEKNKEAAAKK